MLKHKDDGIPSTYKITKKRDSEYITCATTTQWNTYFRIIYCVPCRTWLDHHMNLGIVSLCVVRQSMAWTDLTYGFWKHAIEIRSKDSPCGTPKFSWKWTDKDKWTAAHLYLLFIKDAIQHKASPQMPIDTFRRFTMKEWSITSKAADKSNFKIMQVCWYQVLLQCSLKELCFCRMMNAVCRLQIVCF